MAKYVIEEISAAACEFSLYFDCDCYSEAAGDFGYTIFPILDDCRGYSHNWRSAINEDVYKEINGKIVIDDTIKAALDAYYKEYGASE